MTQTIEIEVLDPATPIAAYDPIKAGIAALAEKYGNTVFPVDTTKDMDVAKAARAEVREVRYNIEAVRKQLKAPAIAYNKRIDDEAKAYTAAILEIEGPIDDVIKAEEAKKAAEKAEREAEESEKRKSVQFAINDIKSLSMMGHTTVIIQNSIAILEAIEITLEIFGDRAGEAEIAKRNTMAQLQSLLEAATKHEAEQAALDADREELARIQQKQAQEAAEARAAIAAEEKRQADVQADFIRQRDLLEAEKAAFAKTVKDKADAEAKAIKDKADAAALAAKQKADAEAAETARRERIQFEANGPGREEIVRVLAEHYRVESCTVNHWLSDIVMNATV